MGEIKKEISIRWHKKMPKFFYWVTVVAACILTTAVTIHLTVESAGGHHVEWWEAVYPYIIGASAGIIAVCRFTVAGGYKKLDPDNITGRTILDKDDN